MEKLGVLVMESVGFAVSLGNGEAVRGTRVCKGVRLRLSGEVVVQKDFLPLDWEILMLY